MPDHQNEPPTTTLASLATRKTRRTAAAIAAGLRSSPRKVRSYQGAPKGPAQPRRPPAVSYTLQDGVELAHVCLSGRHGQGRTLTLDKADWLIIADRFDPGRGIQVVPSYSGDALVVWLQGPAAAAWSGKTNPRHLIPAARFIAGERRRNMAVRSLDHSNFNLSRSNLILEHRRTHERSTPDWTSAQEQSR